MMGREHNEGHRHTDRSAGMKIWRSYGSGHSAHLAVVGKFKNAADAELAREVVDDFVNALWEESYNDIREFLDAWKGRIGGIEVLGPNSADMNFYSTDASLP